MVAAVERCLSDVVFNAADSERNQQYIDYIASMLSAMQDAFKVHAIVPLRRCLHAHV